jgi:hypothetical protein
MIDENDLKLENILKQAQELGIDRLMPARISAPLPPDLLSEIWAKSGITYDVLLPATPGCDEEYHMAARDGRAEGLPPELENELNDIERKTDDEQPEG